MNRTHRLARSTRSTNPTQLVLDRIDGYGLRYRESGASYMAQCPSHDDDSPSLRITEGDDGRALLFCIAGCSTAQIVGELGLELCDLFVPHEGPLPPMKPKLVAVAGGGMATRAEREVIERDLVEIIGRWQAGDLVIEPPLPEPPKRDWDRMWAILADRCAGGLE